MKNLRTPQPMSVKTLLNSALYGSEVYACSVVSLVFIRYSSSFPQPPGNGIFIRIFPFIVNKVAFLYNEHNEETRRDMYKITKEECQQIIDSLNDASFQFLSLYRIFIPKPGRPGKFRPITIPNPRDIIVMDATSMVLNEIFELVFLPSSHGFRKNRGTRTCYWEVLSWKNVHYCIDADVVSCFDVIPHNLLLHYLGTFIQDDKVLNLISFFLKADILDNKGTHYGGTDRGIPQGSPLYPVLMNIYIHQLDMLMDTF